MCKIILFNDYFKQNKEFYFEFYKYFFRSDLKIKRLPKFYLADNKKFNILYCKNKIMLVLLANKICFTLIAPFLNVCTF